MYHFTVKLKVEIDAILIMKELFISKYYGSKFVVMLVSKSLTMDV